MNWGVPKHALVGAASDQALQHYASSTRPAAHLRGHGAVPALVEQREQSRLLQRTTSQVEGEIYKSRELVGVQRYIDAVLHAGLSGGKILKAG